MPGYLLCLWASRKSKCCVKILLGVDGWRKSMEEDARKGGEELCNRNGRISGDRSHVVAACETLGWAERDREHG